MVDFVEVLDRIELPDQFVTILDDPLLQKCVNLRNNELLNMCVDRQLAVSLGSQDFSHRGCDAGKMPQYLVKILRNSLKYSRYAKVCWRSIWRVKVYTLTYPGTPKVCRDILGQAFGPLGWTET